MHHFRTWFNCSSSFFSSLAETWIRLAFFLAVVEVGVADLRLLEREGFSDWAALDVPEVDATEALLVEVTS